MYCHLLNSTDFYGEEGVGEEETGIRCNALTIFIIAAWVLSLFCPAISLIFFNLLWYR